MAVGDVPRPFNPGSPDLADVKNGPLASAGQNLVTIYQEYQAYLRGKQEGQLT